MKRKRFSNLVNWLALLLSLFGCSTRPPQLPRNQAQLNSYQARYNWYRKHHPELMPYYPKPQSKEQ